MGAEAVSLAPRAPYVMFAGMLGANKSQWDSMHKRNYNYLLVDHDPQAPGQLPQRQMPGQVNTGIQSETIIADQELHDTVGLQLAAMGQKSNEKSGKAIQARAAEGEIGQYAYNTNMIRALKQRGRVYLDMIPLIYDVGRIVTIFNEDGSDRQVQVNQEYTDKKTGKTKRHDLTVGRYDVVVTVGPSYQTQREEAADGIYSFLKALPTAGPYVQDLLAKMQDWPYADEIARRLKKTIPEEITREEDGEDGQPQQPATPDPAQQMEMAMMQVKLEQEKAELDKIRAEIRKIEVETRVAAIPPPPPQRKGE